MKTSSKTPNNLRAIRTRLAVRQEDLAREIGYTQANIGHIERGEQTLLPSVAAKVIEFAAKRGITVTYDDLYVVAEESPPAVA
jgi:predicted transcriptional regulator